MPQVAGLDLGVTAATHVAVANGIDITNTFATATTPAGLMRAVHKASNGEHINLVVESTAMSWFLAAVAAERSGVPHTLYRVSGRKAAALRDFYKTHTKTDRIDARVLARMPLVDEGLREFTLPTGTELAFKRLVVKRRKLIDERTRVKDRLRSTFHWVSPGLVSNGGVTDKLLALLRRYPDLRQLAAARTTTIAKVAGMTLEDAARFRQRLNEAVTFYGDRVDYESLALELQLAVEHHQLLDEHIARVETQVHRLHAAAYPNDHLTSLPGVGPVVASTVRAFVGDARHFTSRR